MAITAAQVNDLRQRTGAGMMDCKRALEEANGDIQKAIEILRKKGASVAAKRGEKIEISRFDIFEANNGMLVDYIHMGSKLGVLIKFDEVKNGSDELYLLG